MTDLVERLRLRNAMWLNGSHYMMATLPDKECLEAADEIERLRTALSEIENHPNVSAVIKLRARMALTTYGQLLGGEK